MKKLTLFALIALLAWALEARDEKVKLQVTGAYCAGCAKKLGDAFAEVSAVKGKVALKATKEKPQTITIDLDTDKGDVGDVAKAIAECDTPHKDTVAPSATLVISAPGLTEDNAEKVSDALKEVKGVDAKESKANVKRKEISVKLGDKGG